MAWVCLNCQGTIGSGSDVQVYPIKQQRNYAGLLEDERQLNAAYNTPIYFGRIAGCCYLDYGNWQGQAEDRSFLPR